MAIAALDQVSEHSIGITFGPFIWSDNQYPTVINKIFLLKRELVQVDDYLIRMIRFPQERERKREIEQEREKERDRERMR